MHADRRARRPPGSGTSCPRRRPRVVLFETAGRAHVEVLDLPEDADLGARICHSGRTWTVTAVRTGARVLIAEPIAN